MAEKIISALSCMCNFLASLLASGVFGLSCYLLNTSDTTKFIVSESIFVAFVGLSVIVGTTAVLGMIGSVMSFSKHKLPGLVIVVSMIFLWICELTIGIFLELKKNDIDGFLGIPERLFDTSVDQDKISNEHGECGVVRSANATFHTSSQYGCHGMGLDTEDKSCSFVLSDYYCLLTMILEILILFVLVTQVLSILTLGLHVRKVWLQEDSKVHPTRDTDNS